MSEKTHIYFASDFHLGIPDYQSSRKREDRIVRWLNSIQSNAKEIYLVGDLFDFWFEYKDVAPKGYIRLLGKIAEITDSGIPVHIFTGNHDMWMFGYLEKELGVTVHHQPISIELSGKKFMIGHGDGLGPGNGSYKFIKSIFSNRFFQWCYARLHPNLAFAIANFMSRSSRKANHAADSIYLGDDKEWLVQYCHQVLEKEHFDYFVFGHRHLVLEKEIKPGSWYINLGDWFQYNSYAVFDGMKMEVKHFESGK